MDDGMVTHHNAREKKESLLLLFRLLLHALHTHEHLVV